MQTAQVVNKKYIHINIVSHFAWLLDPPLTHDKHLCIKHTSDTLNQISRFNGLGFRPFYMHLTSSISPQTELTNNSRAIDQKRLKWMSKGSLKSESICYLQNFTHVGFTASLITGIRRVPIFIFCLLYNYISVIVMQPLKGISTLLKPYSYSFCKHVQ